MVGGVRSILLLPLVARCLETIDVCYMIQLLLMINILASNETLEEKHFKIS